MNEDFVLYVRVNNIEANDMPVMAAGFLVNFGPIKRKTTLTYAEIVEQIDKQEFLEHLRLDHMFSPENIWFVTKEEYLAVFPEDDDIILRKEET